MTHPTILGLEATPERAPMLSAVTTWLRAIYGGEGIARPFFVLSTPRGMGKSRMLAAISADAAAKREKRIRECAKCDGTTMIARPRLDRREQRIYDRCDCDRNGVTRLVNVNTPLTRGAALGLQELTIREAGFGEERTEAREQLLRLAHDTRVLLVDEFGGERERPEPWIVGLLRFLDAREGKPTLFATNLDADALALCYADPRIIDRLLGERLTEYRRFEGESYRRRVEAA